MGSRPSYIVVKIPIIIKTINPPFRVGLLFKNKISSEIAIAIIRQNLIQVF
jgi:hypothetical protein